MLKVFIEKTGKLSGWVKVPPSKSYTHRAIIASALSIGLSKIVNPLFSDDTLATVEACKSLGVFVEKVKNGFLIEGKEKLKAPEKPINCKLSAATLRFMVAVACLAEGKTILTGENGLLKRPIEPLIQALNQLGVNCKSSNGFPPVTVYGGNLKGGKTSIVGNVSSQFISGLLFISPLAKNNVEICLTTPLESKPYVQLTLEILKKHGINIEVLGNHEKYLVEGNQQYKPFNHTVPGDFSSASFLMAAAILTGSNIKLYGLDCLTPNQPDMQILNILKNMGAKIKIEKDFVEIVGGEISGIDLDAKDIPDLVPVCVVLACYAKGKTTIKNIRRLRIKESDRVKTIMVELKKMGAKIKKFENMFQIEGLNKLKGATINPHNDHRIAMACTVAALKAEGKTTILNAECVNKSYPNFYKDLQQIGVNLTFSN
ncbi:3-phosphoshikimate 1-carboxyvinyltransferase [Candidatus Bathyarchaeota archaeon]|nr:MAG: 3-phosphoshikimate 1-carboxyvinyltransferase [Candidatus Bathyarchaeota archaeon]